MARGSICGAHAGDVAVKSPVRFRGRGVHPELTTPAQIVKDHIWMRPYIICHMGTSIDGGLHPSRFTQAAAGVSVEALRRHYEAVHDRFEAEGWIVGRKTMARNG